MQGLRPGYASDSADSPPSLKDPKTRSLPSHHIVIVPDIIVIIIAIILIILTIIVTIIIVITELENPKPSKHEEALQLLWRRLPSRPKLPLLPPKKLGTTAGTFERKRGQTFRASVGRGVSE